MIAAETALSPACTNINFVVIEFCSNRVMWALAEGALISAEQELV